MLAFQYDQRGEIPVEPVKRAILDAHQRGVIRLLNELTMNVSGRVVQARLGRLRAALEAKTVQSQAGETVSTVGFKGGKGGRAFVARFLERGTKAHDILPFKRTRGRRHLRAGQGRGKNFGKVKRALSFVVGGGTGGARVFAARVRHPGITARPILGSAVQNAGPAIVEDFRTSIDKALHG